MSRDNQCRPQWRPSNAVNGKPRDAGVISDNQMIIAQYTLIRLILSIKILSVSATTTKGQLCIKLRKSTRGGVTASGAFRSKSGDYA